MADSIHATGGSFGNDAYAEIDGLGFAGFADTVYIAAQVYITAATLAGWTGGATFSPYLLLPKNTTGSGSGVNIYNGGPIFEDDNLGDTTGTPLGDTWMKLEWQLAPTNGTGPETITLDGVVIATGAFGPFTSFNYVDKLALGAIRAGGGPPDGDVYFGEIRVGTTLDGFDKFHFLPATAPDLTAFTSVHNTVVLDTAPSPPPAWGGGGGGGGTPPVFVSAAVNGDTATVVMDQPLQVSPGPSPSEFAVTADSFVVPVVSASVSGSDCILGLAHPVDADAHTTITYTAP